ncbi:hypothetical protein TRFO_36827 [Tritrichomonas foetus]|uniref:UDENN domain-containing protein n=1 Tax=Tritrichomonas foetus TaxID=1144522 RepID=A0A1J4JHD5_9EUKA|nr:hypothetical protein TRFO_36827 [Tritrichomonas foetus]|eukprot:OHS97019.1 hypothetical protein TRFO_36827 [Tritrichomonas foetus]
MLKSIRRRFTKNKKSTRRRRSCVDLDLVAASLSFRQDTGLVFDPSKEEDSHRILNYFFIVGPSPNSASSQSSHNKDSLLNPNRNDSDESDCEKSDSNSQTSDTSSNKNSKNSSKNSSNQKSNRHHSIKQPSLLLTYPSHRFPFQKQDFQRVMQFCYPEGFTNVEKERPFVQFTFGLNDNGTLYFGVCTRFYNKLNNMIQSDLPICLVSITSSTLIQSHMTYHRLLYFILQHCDPKMDLTNPDLLPSNLLREEFDSVSNRVETLETFFQPYQLHLLRSNPLFAVFNDNFDQIFLKFIEVLFRFQMFDDRKQSIKLAPDIKMEILSKKDQLLDIGRVSFSTLFSCLSVNNIARYFRAVLLENQVLLVADDIETLSKCVLATLVMVSPMSTKSAILPILPDDEVFLEYLDTPTPFVFGALETESLGNHNLSEYLTVVDLIHGSIDYPEDVCHVPHVEKLKSQLKDITKDKNGKSHSTGYLFKASTCDKLVKAFTQFNELFVSQERLDGCRVRDTTDSNNPVIGFVKDAYMVNIPDKEVDFYDSLIETQTFQEYCETTYRIPS